MKFFDVSFLILACSSFFNLQDQVGIRVCTWALLFERFFWQNIAIGFGEKRFVFSLIAY